jgi:twitching motility protein PilT
VTIEDPIEYLHPNINSIITQRELGSDTFSFSQALKHVLRQNPDVILVGEMRDSETADGVLSLAETGHLILTTSHASNASQTIERIIDLFPHQERYSAQLRLANLLTAVVCQTLVPRAARSGRIAAVEIIIIDSGIRHLIHEGNFTQISGAVRMVHRAGVTTFDESLVKLYLDGVITMGTVLAYCNDKEEVGRLISVAGE